MRRCVTRFAVLLLASVPSWAWAQADAMAQLRERLSPTTPSWPALAFEERHLTVARGRHLLGREEVVRESAPAGGVLVGLELSVKDRPFREEYAGLRAIYRTREGYRRGRWFGDAGKPTKLLLAPPGHVVGGYGIDLFGGDINAIQLNCYPFDGKRIDKQGRSEQSLGEMRGRLDVELDLGQPVVGLRVHLDKFGDSSRVEAVTLEFGDLDLLQLEAQKVPPLPAVGVSPLAVRELLLTSRADGVAYYYQDAAPARGMVVGFVRYHAVRSGRPDASSIALTPIYQMGERYRIGKRPQHLLGAGTSRVLAKPGYAVAGCEFAGQVLTRLVFAKVTEQGQLDLQDRYLSPILANAHPRQETERWQSGGAPLVGIHYRYSSTLGAIALVTGMPSTEGPPIERSRQLDGQGRPLGAFPLVRVWTSDRGRSVRARLVSFDGSQVQIQKEGGVAFRLPLEKYSPADQAFLKALPVDPPRGRPAGQARGN